MRTARVKAEGAGYYHVMSRVIERRFALGDEEREKFREIMRRVEDFCGVQLLTFCILSNHFHLLVHIPDRVDIDDTELLRRLRLLYPDFQVRAFEQQLKDARAEGNSREVERLRGRYLYRMYDVSQFMKTLKQRMSGWYNRRNQRRGTLWEERFRSIVVEGSENALVMMATYIDLNPVRAGLVQDPKDYRYSGYGEAVGGVTRARQGLCQVMAAFSAAEPDWGKVAGRYRELLYVRGEARGVGANGQAARPGFSAEAVRQVLDKGGQLPLADVLRCRVRYFSDGVAFGSKEFVERVFERYRHRFGAKRQTGARAMRGLASDGLFTLRDLRQQVIIPSAAA